MCKNRRGGGRRGETKGEKMKGKEVRGEDKKSKRLSERGGKAKSDDRREWGR